MARKKLTLDQFLKDDIPITTVNSHGVYEQCVDVVLMFKGYDDYFILLVANTEDGYRCGYNCMEKGESEGAFPHPKFSKPYDDKRKCLRNFLMDFRNNGLYVSVKDFKQCVDETILSLSQLDLFDF